MFYTLSFSGNDLCLIDFIASVSILVIGDFVNFFCCFEVFMLKQK